jgi:putative peptidoglycan lipid II flippase
MRPLLHGGLALASSLSALANMALLFWLLRCKVGLLGGRRMLRTALTAVVASLPMALAAWWIVRCLDWAVTGQKLQKGIVLAVAVLVAVILYSLCSRLFRSEEAVEFWGLLRKKLRR